MAQKENITIDQGATYEQLITISYTGGSAVNLTGYTFAGQIRKTYSDPSVIASFSFAIQNQTTATGQVIASLPATTTAQIPVDAADAQSRTTTDYVYDIEMTDSTGKVRRILEGLAKVSPEVTRA